MSFENYERLGEGGGVGFPYVLINTVFVRVSTYTSVNRGGGGGRVGTFHEPSMLGPIGTDLRGTVCT